MVAATAAAEVSTLAALTLPAEGLEVVDSEGADSIEAALDLESRLASSLGQYLARDTTGVTLPATTTIHMLTITATSAAMITGMPPATASSVSRVLCSAARMAAGIFASNRLRGHTGVCPECRRHLLLTSDIKLGSQQPPANRDRHQAE